MIAKYLLHFKTFIPFQIFCIVFTLIVFATVLIARQQQTCHPCWFHIFSEKKYIIDLSSFFFPTQSFIAVFTLFPLLLFCREEVERGKIQLEEDKTIAVKLHSGAKMITTDNNVKMYDDIKLSCLVHCHPG